MANIDPDMLMSRIGDMGNDRKQLARMLMMGMSRKRHEDLLQILDVEMNFR